MCGYRAHHREDKQHLGVEEKTLVSLGLQGDQTNQS